MGFGPAEVHEIDRERAANTHLSLEKPLDLPYVPPNSLQVGFHWKDLEQVPEEDGASDDLVDSDKELDDLIEQEEEEDEEDAGQEGAYDPLTGFSPPP